MNGRVYDPVLGRFLSPDPLVQFPAVSQSWNRYSYVNNTPTSFTDPTGYFRTQPMEEIEVRGSRGSAFGSRSSMLHAMGSLSVSNGGGIGSGGGLANGGFGVGVTEPTETQAAEADESYIDEIIVTEKRADPSVFIAGLYMQTQQPPGWAMRFSVGFLHAINVADWVAIIDNALYNGEILPQWMHESLATAEVGLVQAIMGAASGGFAWTGYEMFLVGRYAGGRITLAASAGYGFTSGTNKMCNSCLSQPVTNMLERYDPAGIMAESGGGGW